MNKTIGIILLVLFILLGGTGILVYKIVTKPVVAPTNQEEEVVEILPAVDASVVVSVTKSKTAANTIIVAAANLDNKYAQVEYEFTYESAGLVKGVNSGSKPIDVTGKDTFEREVYLGTCSRNVCKPDTGVTQVSVVLKLTDTSGARSQFTGEFEI